MKNNKIYPILLAFVCMGFQDAVGAFVGLAQEKYELSKFLAGLIPLVGLISFGVLSIPMGLVQDRTSKKFILLLGLIIGLSGTGISVLGQSSFLMFLATVLLLGIGGTILQVAGNPIMLEHWPVR